MVKASSLWIFLLFSSLWAFENLRGDEPYYVETDTSGNFVVFCRKSINYYDVGFYKNIYNHKGKLIKEIDTTNQYEYLIDRFGSLESSFPDIYLRNGIRYKIDYDSSKLKDTSLARFEVPKLLLISKNGKPYENSKIRWGCDSIIDITVFPSTNGDTVVVIPEVFQSPLKVGLLKLPKQKKPRYLTVGNGYLPDFYSRVKEYEGRYWFRWEKIVGGSVDTVEYEKLPPNSPPVKGKLYKVIECHSGKKTEFIAICDFENHHVQNIQIPDSIQWIDFAVSKGKLFVVGKECVFSDSGRYEELRTTCIDVSKYLKDQPKRTFWEKMRDSISALWKSFVSLFSKK